MHEDLLHEDLQRREFKFLKLNDTALTAQNNLYYATQNPLSPVAESFVSLLRAARDNKSQIGGRLPSALISFQPSSSRESTGIASRKKVDGIIFDFTSRSTRRPEASE